MSLQSKQQTPLHLIVWVLSITTLLAVLLGPAIIRNMSRLLYSFETGEIRNLRPMPLYGFMQPGNKKPESRDFTLGADFADIYYPAKHLFTDNIYNTTQYDIYERFVGYPPFLCAVYNKSFCRLDYPHAVIAHELFQITLLILSSFLILNYYRLAFFIFPVTLTFLSVLFLTPVGLSWAERGQCDIYPALAILFYIFAVYESKAYAFILAGIFASFKPTVAPFLIQASLIYLLIDFNSRKLLQLSLLAGTMIVLQFIFFKQTLAFLHSVKVLNSSVTEGITLVSRMPHLVVAIIPLVCLLVYLIAFWGKSSQLMLKTFFPYATGLVMIDILLPFTSWEYRTVCFLGFLPMAIAWSFYYRWDRILRGEFLSSFVIIMVVMYHGFWFISDDPPKWEYFISAYIGYYLTMTAICLSRAR